MKSCDIYTRCFSSRRRFSFFFNDPASTEIYTLSLHDALPILPSRSAAMIAIAVCSPWPISTELVSTLRLPSSLDRKSTRLNSSHSQISYAVFCLKKKKKNKNKDGQMTYSTRID